MNSGKSILRVSNLIPGSQDRFRSSDRQIRLGHCPWWSGYAHFNALTLVVQLKIHNPSQSRHFIEPLYQSLERRRQWIFLFLCLSCISGACVTNRYQLTFRYQTTHRIFYETKRICVCVPVSTAAPLYPQCASDLPYQAGYASNRVSRHPTCLRTDPISCFLKSILRRWQQN